MPIGASMVNGGQVFISCSLNIVQLCIHAINSMGVQYFSSQVIVERASRDDAGMYECWDTSGEAASKTKQVQLFPLMTK